MNSLLEIENNDLIIGISNPDSADGHVLRVSSEGEVKWILNVNTIVSDLKVNLDDKIIGVGGNSIFLLEKTGGLLWKKDYNYSHNSLIVTGENEYIACGGATGGYYGNDTGLIRKFSVNGDTLWSELFNNIYFEQVIQMKQSHYILSGTDLSFFSPQGSSYILHLYDSGDKKLSFYQYLLL